MDVDRVRLGNWRRQINDALANSAVVVVLIGPCWLEELNKRPKSKDEVRYEIAKAIELRRAVVPVTLGRTEIPDRDKLPDDIAALFDEEAYPLLEDKGWEPTVKILIDDVEAELAAEDATSFNKGA